jgi:hypothetical protein
LIEGAALNGDTADSVFYIESGTVKLTAVQRGLQINSKLVIAFLGNRPMSVKKT